MQAQENGANSHAGLQTGTQKARLQWTPDLHALFLRAVAHLGGPDKVSPKGIVEYMSVDGLTIYHVKSHLQKHRLQLRSGAGGGSGHAGPVSPVRQAVSVSRASAAGDVLTRAGSGGPSALSTGPATGTGAGGGRVQQCIPAQDSSSAVNSHHTTAAASTAAAPAKVASSGRLQGFASAGEPSKPAQANVQTASAADPPLGRPYTLGAAASLTLPTALAPTAVPGPNAAPVSAAAAAAALQLAALLVMPSSGSTPLASSLGPALSAAAANSALLAKLQLQPNAAAAASFPGSGLGFPGTTAAAALAALLSGSPLEEMLRAEATNAGSSVGLGFLPIPPLTTLPEAAVVPQASANKREGAALARALLPADVSLPACPPTTEGPASTVQAQQAGLAEHEAERNTKDKAPVVAPIHSEGAAGAAWMAHVDAGAAVAAAPIDTATPALNKEAPGAGRGSGGAVVQILPLLPVLVGDAVHVGLKTEGPAGAARTAHVAAGVTTAVGGAPTSVVTPAAATAAAAAAAPPATAALAAVGMLATAPESVPAALTALVASAATAPPAAPAVLAASTAPAAPIAPAAPAMSVAPALASAATPGVPRVALTASAVLVEPAATAVAATAAPPMSLPTLPVVAEAGSRSHTPNLPGGSGAAAALLAAAAAAGQPQDSGSWPPSQIADGAAAGGSMGTVASEPSSSGASGFGSRAGNTRGLEASGKAGGAPVPSLEIEAGARAGLAGPRKDAGARTASGPGACTCDEEAVGRQCSAATPPHLQSDPGPLPPLQVHNMMRRGESGTQKARLQWTPDLHALFLRAVAHLGGPDKVSPKGIVEYMCVDGLTIYHVKSHLQKHRLQLKASEGQGWAVGSKGGATVGAGSVSVEPSERWRAAGVGGMAAGRGSRRRVASAEPEVYVGRAAGASDNSAVGLRRQSSGGGVSGSTPIPPAATLTMGAGWSSDVTGTASDAGLLPSLPLPVLLPMPLLTHLSSLPNVPRVPHIPHLPHLPLFARPDAKQRGCMQAAEAEPPDSPRSQPRPEPAAGTKAESSISNQPLAPYEPLHRAAQTSRPGALPDTKAELLFLLDRIKAEPSSDCCQKVKESQAAADGDGTEEAEAALQLQRLQAGPGRDEGLQARDPPDALTGSSMVVADTLAPDMSMQPKPCMGHASPLSPMRAAAEALAAAEAIAAEAAATAAAQHDGARVVNRACSSTLPASVPPSYPACAANALVRPGQSASPVPVGSCSEPDDTGPSSGYGDAMAGADEKAFISAGKAAVNGSVRRSETGAACASAWCAETGAAGAQAQHGVATHAEQVLQRAREVQAGLDAGLQRQLEEQHRLMEQLHAHKQFMSSLALDAEPSGPAAAAIAAPAAAAAAATAIAAAGAAPASAGERTPPEHPVGVSQHGGGAVNPLHGGSSAVNVVSNCAHQGQGIQEEEPSPVLQPAPKRLRVQGSDGRC